MGGQDEAGALLAQLSPGFWESGQSQVQSTVHLSFLALSITAIFPRFEGCFFLDECLSPIRL